VVVPAGEGLVAASPVQPVPGEAWRGGLGEQAGDLGYGQRDHAGVGWRWLAGPDRERGLRAGAVPEQGGGDGADSRRSHDQHGVAGDGGVEADLGLVQAEAVLMSVSESAVRQTRGVVAAGR